MSSARADEHHGSHHVSASYAPIGVMGDHMLHKKGEFMVSLRFMRMDMEGNRIGTERVSPEYVATNVVNRFAPPPTLRIVPLNMTMDMAMLGFMYAPTNWATLMFMGTYVSKNMEHVTYTGPTGTNVLGYFKTESSGIGDTGVGGLFRLIDTPNNRLHFDFGFTIPTGGIKETDRVLAPTGAQPTVRMPYAMQLGSGTWNIKSGLTYNGGAIKVTWGAQYAGTFRIGNNDASYNLGTVHELTGWGAWNPQSWVSVSARLAWQDKDSIDGIDAQIMGPVQTANPDFYGGEILFGYLGLSLTGQSAWSRGQRVALEAGWPIEQNLNGPQLESDFTMTVGWEYAF